MLEQTQVVWTFNETVCFCWTFYWKQRFARFYKSLIYPGERVLRSAVLPHFPARQHRELPRPHHMLWKCWTFWRKVWWMPAWTYLSVTEISKRGWLPISFWFCRGLLPLEISYRGVFPDSTGNEGMKRAASIAGKMPGSHVGAEPLPYCEKKS